MNLLGFSGAKSYVLNRSVLEAETLDYRLNLNANCNICPNNVKRALKNIIRYEHLKAKYHIKEDVQTEMGAKWELILTHFRYKKKS